MQKIKHRQREPGKGAGPAAIFEVWGDVLDYTMLDRDLLADLAVRTVQHMHSTLSALLYAGEEARDIVWCTDAGDHPYLLIKWKGMQGEIGARPFGSCLDLFGILVLHRNIITEDVNPLVRLAEMTASERRDVGRFQSLLKYVLEQTIEALDEQRIK
jgi:hypothetical protein